MKNIAGIFAMLLLSAALSAQTSITFAPYLTEGKKPVFGALLTDTLKNTADSSVAFRPQFVPKSSGGRADTSLADVFKSNTHFFNWLLQGTAKQSADDRRLAVATKLGKIIKQLFPATPVHAADSKSAALLLNPVVAFHSSASVDAVNFFLNTICALENLDTAFHPSHFRMAHLTYYRLPEFNYKGNMAAIDPNPATHALLFADGNKNFFSAKQLTDDTGRVSKGIKAYGYKAVNNFGESLLKWYEVIDNYPKFFIGNKCEHFDWTPVAVEEITSEIVLPGGASLVFSYLNDAVAIDTSTADGRKTFTEMLSLYDQYNRSEDEKTFGKLINLIVRQSSLSKEQVMKAAENGKLVVYGGGAAFRLHHSWQSAPFNPVAHLIIPPHEQPLSLKLPFIVLDGSSTLWQGSSVQDNTEAQAAATTPNASVVVSLPPSTKSKAIPVAINPALINWVNGLTIATTAPGALVSIKQ